MRQQREHNSSDLLVRLGLGAAAGMAGTVLIYALRTGSQKWAPSTVPPMRREPGEFMVEKAEELLDYRTREKIPRTVETSAAKALSFGYGMTFGALYAALRPKGGSILLDGVLLGLLTWAAGYLGWLPATGLMRPVWKQSAPEAIAPVVRHAAFGAATVAAYDALAEKLG